ncbi:hypothetical protein [Psittacicella hinzii]|nr:hypothetical protein [Psittacicella hinzii]
MADTTNKSLASDETLTKRLTELFYRVVKRDTGVLNVVPEEPDLEKAKRAEELNQRVKDMISSNNPDLIYYQHLRMQNDATLYILITHYEKAFEAYVKNYLIGKSFDELRGGKLNREINFEVFRKIALSFIVINHVLKPIVDSEDLKAKEVFYEQFEEIEPNMLVGREEYLTANGVVRRYNWEEILKNVY